MFETCSVGLISYIPDISIMIRIQIESIAPIYLYLCHEDLYNNLRITVIASFIQRTWNSCPVCYANRSHLALWLMLGLSVLFTIEISSTCIVVEI